MQILVDYLSNRLTVEGDAASVARAKELLEAGRSAASSVIGFGEVLPLPMGDASEERAWGSYEEAAQRVWGCWGDPIVPKVVEDAADRFSVTFDTAQSAPAAVAEALSRLVPEASVSLECAWVPDPQSISAAGRWSGGVGSLEPAEPTREHYLRVRPDARDWDLDDKFPERSPSP